LTSYTIHRGVIRKFFRQAKPIGGHNLLLLVEIGLMYLKIWVKKGSCLACLTIGYAPDSYFGYGGW
jgi:hypothetical protein